MIRLFIKFMLFLFCVGLRPFGALSLAQEDILQDASAMVAKPVDADSVKDLHNLDVVKDLLTNMINPFLSKLPPEPVEPEIVEPINPLLADNIPADLPVDRNYPGLEVPYSDQSNPQSVPVEPLPVLIDPPEIALMGIIYDTNHPQALFNNRIVSTGDEVEGIKVVEISRSGIVVEYKGASFAFGMDDRKVNQ